MILDIIPIPIKVCSDVNMEIPLFYRNDLFRTEVEQFWTMSRQLENLNGLYRYKIIEIADGAILEHVVLTFDEMHPLNLSIIMDKKVDVDVYPISTKIAYQNGGCTTTYRHRQGIQSVISKLTGKNPWELESIHNMFVNMVGVGTWKENHLDLAEKWLPFKREIKPRLKALLTSDEEASELIMTRMNEIAHMLSYDVAHGCEGEFFVDLVEEMSCIPRLAKADCLSKLWYGETCVSSFKLRPHFFNLPFSKPIIHQLTSQDVFPLDADVEESLPERMRWELHPLIDKLGSLPYTDLSITITPDKMNVNYAISMIPNTPTVLDIKNGRKGSETFKKLWLEDYTFKTPTYVEGLAIVMSKFAHSIGLDPRRVTCTIVKTFRDDVYIRFSGDENFDDEVEAEGIPTKFYLDLTMCTLGTRTLVSRAFANEAIPTHY